MLEEMPENNFRPKSLGTQEQFEKMSRQERIDCFARGWVRVVSEGLGPNSETEIYDSQIHQRYNGADIGDGNFTVNPVALDLESLNHLLKMESRASN